MGHNDAKAPEAWLSACEGRTSGWGVRFGVPGPHPYGFDGFASCDMHHCHLLEHRHHDMMRPYVVLSRRLSYGAADGHGADARIPGRPPNP
jgi:hypothetical protein